jgi:hypothetical protein
MMSRVCKTPPGFYRWPETRHHRRLGERATLADSFRNPESGTGAARGSAQTPGRISSAAKAPQQSILFAYAN